MGRCSFKKPPCHKQQTRNKHMKKSLEQQYGENCANIQWDIENVDMANEVEDFYVPPLPNQSNLEYNTSLKSVEV